MPKHVTINHNADCVYEKWDDRLVGHINELHKWINRMSVINARTKLLAIYLFDHNYQTDKENTLLRLSTNEYRSSRWEQDAVNRLNSQILSDMTDKPGRSWQQIDRLKNTLSTRTIGNSSVIGDVNTHNWGTAVAQWLRYCATNRKVAGSIPDGCHWNFSLT
jgi:hypothetical protein